MDWVAACNAAVSTPLETLRRALFACTSVVIAAYAFSFGLAAFLFYRWKVAKDDIRAQAWRHFGLFTVVVATGSLFGAIGWGSRMRQRELQ